MFGFIAKAVGTAVRAVKSTFRKIFGIGADNIPDALSVFTVVSRVAVVCLGTLALLATLMPILSADPVAVRLLGVSHSLWDAGTRAGYESRLDLTSVRQRDRVAFGIEPAPRPGRVMLTQRDVFSLGDEDDDEDDLPYRR